MPSTTELVASPSGLDPAQLSDADLAALAAAVKAARAARSARPEQVAARAAHAAGVAARRAAREERKAAELEARTSRPVRRRLPVLVGAPAAPARRLAGPPATRGDCIDGPRPCGSPGCRYFIESTPEQSCALDLSGAGGMTLDEVGAIFGVTRERIRQIEVQALETLARRAAAMGLEPSDLHEQPRRAWLARSAR